MHLQRCEYCRTEYKSSEFSLDGTAVNSLPKSSWMGSLNSSNITTIGDVNGVGNGSVLEFITNNSSLIGSIGLASLLLFRK